MLNTKVLYAQPKPLDPCVDKKSKKRRIMNEHAYGRSLTSMDIQPLVKLPRAYHNGGAFVPLDPSNPIDRTKAILGSVNARFVLTSSTYRGTFKGSEAKIVVVDSHFRRKASMSSMPSVDVSPHSPAFVLFASGSMGHPKGVVQEHASVCTISKAYRETLGDRLLFNTLIHGGCVCMPSEFQRKNKIVSVINDMKVNWADITPSFSNTFAPEDVPSLRTIVLTGKEVNKEQVERWAGKVRLINCYGPSECGGCTAHEYAGSDSSPDTMGRAAATSMVAFPKTSKYANQLVAVIELCGEDASHDNSGAKTFMKGRLPGYMIASVWLAIDRIPLSTSIKVDRRQVDRLLAGLELNDTRIALLGSREQGKFAPLPPSNALAHEISVKVAELLVSRNNDRLASLIGYDFRLAALGFDFIQAMTLRVWIKNQFDANILVSKLTSDTITISGLADLISQSMESASTTVKLLQDIEAMCSELHAWDMQPATNPAKTTDGRARLVFLTGATGCLGREILDQLIGKSEFGKVFVLIRCNNHGEGYTRIAEVAGEAILRYPGKIEIWPGDLQQTRLGLADEYWETISRDETLRKANVLSTMEILKISLMFPVVNSFVYVSGGQQLTPGKDDAASFQQVTASSGRLGSHNRFSVLKPSYIIRSTRDGVANTTDYFWRLVAGAIEISAHSGDEPNNIIYLSDVETVARSTISAAVIEPSNSANNAQVIKILDGITIADFWQVVREAGYPLRSIPSEQWWHEMRENVHRGGEKHCLWPLMWMLEDRHRGLGAAIASGLDHGSDEADFMMRSRVKAAVARNLRWLQEEKALPG
ncbi:MAG: hypothetical protein Q9184_002852 [Pyrenodesmia sp. 2 TL-2023]